MGERPPARILWRHIALGIACLAIAALGIWSQARGRGGAATAAFLPLRETGETTALEGICRVSAVIWSGEIVRRNGPEQTLDREALAGAVLRTRREGDKIRPLGMRGTKLLSDYLTDRRVARPLRDTLPLVACGERVLWVVGVGISNDAAAREDRAMVRLRAEAWRPEWKF